MANEAHFVLVGRLNGSKVGVMLPDKYSEIGPIIGVTKLGDADTVDLFTTVGELVRGGNVIHMKLRLAGGKTGTIIADIDKAQNARGQLKGKTWGGVEILSASIPRSRRLK